jgi:hypothetical protein
MFTQKHYIAIADLIHKRRVAVKAKDVASTFANEPPSPEIMAINEITLDLCRLFKADNPKFKEFTFIEACNRDLKE